MRLNREQFLETLELVKPGVSKQEVVEQSSCFVFDRGWVQTYNDEVACWAKTPLKISGAVSAEPLLELLHKMAEDEITIVQENGELIIGGKNRSAGIALQSEVTLPNDGVERPEAWHDLPAEFIEAIGIVQECAGKDESQFVMTCIHLHPKWIEACDNAQAVRYRIATGLSEPCLAKRDSLKHIVSMGMTQFGETASWLHFRSPSKAILACRRWSEDYPSLRDILNVQGEPFSLPKGLSDAAEKAAVFARQNQMDDQISIELKPGVLWIKGHGVHGWYKEKKKINYTGRPLSFTIGPELLSQIVKRHAECEITKARLKVDGGKFKYVSCLGTSEELPEVEPEE